MKINKFIMMVVIIFIVINVVGCSDKDKIGEAPYVEYIITTYSGGKEIDKFEVWSNMGWYFGNSTAKVYDSPSETVLLFRTTLDYKVENVSVK